MIRGMAVRSGHQGKDGAQRLLDAAEAALRGQQCTRVVLETTDVLQRAMAFYRRNGYERTGKVRDYYGMELFEYEKALR